MAKKQQQGRLAYQEEVPETTHSESHINQKQDTSLKISRLSKIKSLFDVKRHRIKRSSVFPTGVKVCPQESLKQVLDSHLAYYKLRVCQEAVWEAYRIFLDRIPQSSEYQSWVDACQQESFCIFEIGKNFSSSQEHSDIIIKRNDGMPSESTLPPAVTEISSSINGLSVEKVNDTLLNEIINDTKEPLKEIEVTNQVPEQPVQQTVEFTVTLKNQEFTKELRDPSSSQYQELAKSFQFQMEKVFHKLPGFKEIQVLRFRQKKEKDGSDSIVVGYAVVFERGSESKNNIDQTPSITSNNVENGSIQEPKEMSYTVIELQNMVAMALRDDQSLPVDLQTLWFADDPDKSFGHIENDAQTFPTISASKNKQHIYELGTSGDSPDVFSHFPSIISSTYSPEIFPKESISPTESIPFSTYLDSHETVPPTQGTVTQLPGSVLDTLSKTTKSANSYDVTSSPGTPATITVGDTLLSLPPSILKNDSANQYDLTTNAPHAEGKSPPTSVDIANTDRLPILENYFPTTVQTTHNSESQVSQNGNHEFTTQDLKIIVEGTEEWEYGTEKTSGDGNLLDYTPESSVFEHVTTGSDRIDKSNDLVVFFSLRVTNIPFSDLLFNKSSPEYKALEQQFLHLLLPYLQSNLTGFKNIEILSFKKGSVIVNSKLKFEKSIPYNVTEAVHCVLDEGCNTAAELLNLKIDSYSLDIEHADQADPCKFLACDQFSQCVINTWTKEASCHCKAGYKSLRGLPCQSICELELNYCAKGQTCVIIPEQGAVC
ncbi:hypothetical protein GDO86_009858, partial [Hymenochirus boettgeri]